VPIELEFPPDPESEENNLSRGAIGFLCVIGLLSFADARATEASIIEYVEEGKFQVGDLIACLKWEDGALRFSTDYVRGRRMKTRVVLRLDGSGTLPTTGRDKAAIRRLERLKGKNPMQAVEP
jgi:hypothetical protein